MQLDENKTDAGQVEETPEAQSTSQEEMLRLYREQQKRQRCVGCGEGEEFF